MSQSSSRLVDYPSARGWVLLHTLMNSQAWVYHFADACLAGFASSDRLHASWYP